MKRFLASLLLFMIVGCGAIAGLTGAAAPTTFQGRVDTALAQNTAARKACTDMVDRNRISADQGQQCLELTGMVRKSIDAANAAGEANGGTDQLRQIQQAMMLVESYLQEKAK